MEKVHPTMSWNLWLETWCCGRSQPTTFPDDFDFSSQVKTPWEFPDFHAGRHPASATSSYAPRARHAVFTNTSTIYLYCSRQSQRYTCYSWFQFISVGMASKQQQYREQTSRFPAVLKQYQLHGDKCVVPPVYGNENLEQDGLLKMHGLKFLFLCDGHPWHAHLGQSAFS